MKFTREEITSELFIHKTLLVEAEAMTEYIYEAWKETKGHLPCLGFAWPSEHLHTKEGIIKHLVTTTFQSSPTNRAQELRDFVRLSKAYALFVIEQHDDYVKAIFESMHGSRAWTLKIARHGDSKVLSRPTVSDDLESIGLLWKKNGGSA